MYLSSSVREDVMAPISKLDSIAEAKLRSGTIIDSVQTVIRGLISNAVDSGATSIILKIDLQSLSVCVKDNGLGIDPSMMKYIGRRYYTSKGRGSNELEPSLYHQGETLNSISLVSSKLAMMSSSNGAISSKIFSSKPSPKLMGVLISFFDESSPKQGTMVIASRLFHTMPVRLKYIRAMLSEDLIIREVKNIIFETSVAGKSISFLAMFLTKGSFTTFLKAESSPSALSQYSSLYGLHESKFFSISGERKTISMEGFFYPYSLSKSPSCFVFYNKTPMTLSAKELTTIRSLLNSAGYRTRKQSTVARSICYTSLFCIMLTDRSQRIFLPDSQRSLQSIWSDIVALLKQSLAIELPAKHSQLKTQHESTKQNGEGPVIKLQLGNCLDAPVSSSISIQDLYEGNFRVVSQIDCSFIVICVKNTLFAVDQHACDERIVVETLFKEFLADVANPACDLRLKCDPEISFPLENGEVSLFNNTLAFLRPFGIDLFVTHNSCTITHLPRYIYKLSEPISLKECILQHIHKVQENSKRPTTVNSDDWFSRLISVPQIIIEAINSLACRSSIKFGQILTIEEMYYLISNLVNCQLPFQCAHGRPTIQPMSELGSIQTFNLDYEI